MAQKPICQELADELSAVIDRYAENALVSYAEAIGCLEIVKLDCYMSARDETLMGDAPEDGLPEIT